MNSLLKRILLSGGGAAVRNRGTNFVFYQFKSFSGTAAEEEVERRDDGDDVGQQFDSFLDEAEKPGPSSGKQQRKSVNQFEVEHREGMMLLRKRMDELTGHTRQLPLTTAVKRRMLDLHASDPVGWSVDQLSTRFGVPKDRCRAILVLQAVEARYQAGVGTPAHLKPFGSDVDDGLANLFPAPAGATGSLATAAAAALHPSTPAPQSSTNRRVVRAQQKDEIPAPTTSQGEQSAETENHPDDGAAAVVLEPGTRKTRLGGPTIVAFYDSDDKKGKLAGQQAADIVVRDADGSLREPTGDERRLFRDGRLPHQQSSRSSWNAVDPLVLAARHTATEWSKNGHLIETKKWKQFMANQMNNDKEEEAASAAAGAVNDHDHDGDDGGAAAAENEDESNAENEDDEFNAEKTKAGD